MKARKPTNGRLTQALARESRLKEATAAQQAEIEQLREVVSQLTAAKPGRPFRARTLLHGGLDVKLKGVDLPEQDVWIEHRGEVLVILVGRAAEAAYRGTAPRLIATPARFGDSNEVEKQAESRPQPEIRRPQVDLQEQELQKVGLDATSLGANVSLFGQPLSSVFTDDGRPVVNASVAPQGDPRQPGGWQDRSEAAQVAQQYGGYTGQGPRPAGWVDPDTQPS